jgi:hypothetical protein
MFVTNKKPKREKKKESDKFCKETEEEEGRGDSEIPFWSLRFHFSSIIQYQMSCLCRVMACKCKVLARRFHPDTFFEVHLLVLQTKNCSLQIVHLINAVSEKDFWHRYYILKSNFNRGEEG